MKDSIILPTPSEMIAHLDRFVHGQARAKQDIAVAVYNHYLSQAYREQHGIDLGRHHILLVGPTGVGKTYLVKTLADFLGVPVGFASAAGLVEMGYKGNSVETIVRALVDRAGGSAQRAEKGIIFIDEIDKIKRSEGSHRDISGEGVQNALLTLLDGRKSEGYEGMSHKSVDTSRLLFICTGAFVGLEKIINSRLDSASHQIGFRVRLKEQQAGVLDQPVYHALCQAQTSDFVEFGLIPEFVGRFATITVLHELMRGDLREIISDQTEFSALQKQKQLAAIHGIELLITPDALDTIAAEAEVLKTGARGLHRLIGKAVDAVDFRWSELAAQGIDRVEINTACLKGEGDPVLSSNASGFTRMDLDLRTHALDGLPRKPSPVYPEPVNPPKSTPSGITDTRSWSDEQLWNALEQLKISALGWNEASQSVHTWWSGFENENKHRPALLYRLAEEIKLRESTLQEFYTAYLYSNTDNIQANLHYLDYLKLKNREKPPGQAS